MDWGSILSGLGKGLTLGSAVSDVFGAYNKAKASQQQSAAQKMANEAQASVADNNAQLAMWQAQDALYRGQVAENRATLATAGLKGAQRAGFAANGLALDSDSVARTLTDTDVLGGIDAMTARENGEREAWALRVQAQDSRNRASILRSATVPVPDSASNAVIGSLLSGAGRVAKAWYR